MESRSKNRFAGLTVVCAATSLALAPAAAGNVPGQVTEVQNSVGEAIAQVLTAPKAPPAPVQPAPAPRPAPAPQPAAAAPRAPSPPAARSAAPAPVNRASTARATAAGADASTGQAAPADPKPKVSQAARDKRTAGTPERADSASRIELVAAGDLSADAGEENPSTLPFTGLPLLPLMAGGVLMLFAGIGVRRTVQ
jgi:hypothetical protein